MLKHQINQQYESKDSLNLHVDHSHNGISSFFFSFSLSHTLVTGYSLQEGGDLFDGPERGEGVVEEVFPSQRQKKTSTPCISLDTAEKPKFEFS